LDQVPPKFNKNDVCRALGQTPQRASLHRVLQELIFDGTLEVEYSGIGRRPTVYRKVLTALTGEMTLRYGCAALRNGEETLGNALTTRGSVEETFRSDLGTLRSGGETFRSTPGWCPNSV